MVKPPKFKPVYFVIILVTLISYQTITDRTIFPNVPKRMELQNSILSGQSEAPYQYRVMKPALGFAVQQVISPFVSDPMKVHTLSYQFLILIAFFGIYTQLYCYLKLFFDDTACIIGLLLMQVIIPLGITSIWEEGDYYTLFFYLLGLNAMFRNKDYYIPLIILAGTFNRNQIIFLLVFYAAYLYQQRKLFNRKSIIVMISGVAALVIVSYGLRFYYGFKLNPYGITHEIRSNIDYRFAIFTVWSEQVIIFIIMSAIAFKRSPVFFRLSFLSLILYVTLFFFNSILSQLAKFLPAYLIMIPMSLQVLTGQTILSERSKT